MPQPIAALIEPALNRAIAAAARRPFVLGISGAQGSGKSTLAEGLARRLRSRGTRCAVLSLDDLYLDGAARRTLVAQVHPLLATRGVPGTHDVAAGLALIDRLGAGEAVRLPRFDKACDEPFPAAAWQPPQHADVLILEGWCVGARPQPETELAEPVNALEREHDPQGVWRGYVNARLTGPYRALFERIDLLVLLSAPSFGVVAGWRAEQEQALRRARGAAAGMSDDQLHIFVQHYQRITEQMLRQGSEWADITIALDTERQPVAVSEVSRHHQRDGND